MSGPNGPPINELLKQLPPGAIQQILPLLQGSSGPQQGSMPPPDPNNAPPPPGGQSVPPPTGNPMMAQALQKQMQGGM